MWYKFLAVLLVFWLAGCGGEPITGKETVKIERSVRAGTDPHLLIVAEKAVLEYDQRIIRVSGVKNITGTGFYSDFGGGWVVNKIELDQEGGMIITIPSDADYGVWIGGQYNLGSRLEDIFLIV